MSFSDILIVFKWWIMLFAIGIAFLPLTYLIFSNFIDRGYIFARIIGAAIVSYCVFVLGSLKILPFNSLTIYAVVIGFIIINFLLIFPSSFWGASATPESRFWTRSLRSLARMTGSWRIFLFEEMLFLGILLFWSFIHAHQPEIHGLEKYMDFGFINSIFRTDYFPPVDMWFTPLPINYYYFGHLTTAVLTKLSFLPSAITFNLMLSTVSALGFVSAFSIGANLLNNLKFQISNFKLIMGGLLTAFVLNFAGNLHALYSFFKPYANDNPLPFWNLIFSPQTFPNNYWYPNATRFIENTIHEFPIYSSVVSDLHGHFLDIPFVLLTIAVLLSLINSKHEIRNSKQSQNSNLKTATQNLKVFSFKFISLSFELCALSFILAIMYMTNAWDGVIYFILATTIIGYSVLRSIINSTEIKNSKFKTFIKLLLPKILILGLLFFVFALPFNINFKPFASGIGILCAPEFLTDLGKFGPFLFEVNHCQHSPLWQLAILYGFFYFWVISFIVFLFEKKNSDSGQARMTSFWGAKRLQNLFRNLNSSDIFVLILIILSTLLIILPEFIYVKDIYPAHYRANTMFKLVYESFIMLSISSGYIIVRLFPNFKSLILDRQYWLLGYWVIGLLGLLIVFLYPYFAIKSYFGDLKIYSGLNGTKYLKALYSSDYETILWINKNIKAQPVILEAQGDSYTDYARISSNTGLPTVLGWTVHEWLWRGTYDVPAPRIEEVKNLYESNDLNTTKQLIQKHNISFIFVGELEHQKYPNLNEGKFTKLGKIIYQNNQTKIYKIN